MKIEMAESLLASWLRHVKECQTVQMNWKASKTWELKNQQTLLTLMQRSSDLFTNQYGYNIYRNSALAQLIQQAEIDVLGVKLDAGETQIYAIDVAFHEAGLNYGDRQETIERIIKKCLRSAMCIYGYYGLTTGEIIFASPKIQTSMMSDIRQCVERMQEILGQVELAYSIRVIANDEFSDHILQPVLSLLPSIADSGELFVRSLQMYNMFARASSNRAKNSPAGKKSAELEAVEGNVLDGQSEMKIGLIARTILRTMLEEDRASPQEIQLMQTLEYSKQTFDIQYPLLQKASQEFDRMRYYAAPLTIYGESYFLCSQWFEVPANNDRPYLLKWLDAHQ
jgi:hypothetical protein